MTEADRMFQVLVTAMTSSAPEQLTRPFAVADLYQNILPYRLFRRELGLETNQDSEITLMELLAGAGDYLVVEERMKDVLTRELAAPSPDSGTFRQFATAQVSINPDALARAAHQGEQRSTAATAQPRTGHQAPAHQPVLTEVAVGAMSATPASEPAAGAGTGALRRQPMVPAAGESCRFCGGRLPEGRPITYCPHCGQDQTVLHCDACGTELEVGWKFCTTCGRKVATA